MPGQSDPDDVPQCTPRRPLSEALIASEQEAVDYYTEVRTARRCRTSMQPFDFACRQINGRVRRATGRRR